MLELTTLQELEDEPTAKLIEPKAEATIEEKAKAETLKSDDREKAKKRLSDRLKEETYHRREAERKLELSNKLLEEMEVANKLQSEPKEDDYADFTKFKSDQNKWIAQKENEIEDRVTKRITAANQEKQYNQSMQEKQKIYLTHREPLAKEDDKFHDYEVAIDDAVSTWGAPEIQSLILNAKEYGPQIVKYLGNHPDDLVNIASAPQSERSFLMGRLLAKLEAKPVKKITSASDPVRPGSKSAIVEANPSNETVSEYIKRKNFG